MSETDLTLSTRPRGGRRGGLPGRGHAHCWRLCLVLLAVVGGLAPGQQPPPGAIGLANPGFEAGKQGWSEELFKRFEGLISIERQASHGGNVALKITARRGSENPSLAQTVDKLQGGATYALRAWVKGEGQGTGPLAAIKLEFINAAGTATSSRSTRGQPAPGGQWQVFEVSARADADTLRATVVLRLFGTGTVWFDDVELVQLASAPPLTLDPPRQIVRAAAGSTAAVVVHLATEWEGPGNPPLSFTLSGADQAPPRPLTAELRRHDSRTFVASLSLPGVGPGNHEITCSLPDTPMKASARLLVPAVRQPPKTLTDRGVLLAAGKPFFPIGLYHVGTGDYFAVAKRGFNCVQGLAAADLRVFGSSLDAALRAGLKVDVPLYGGGKVRDNLALSRQKLERFRGHRAVLSWKILDEPDVRPEVSDEVPEVYAALRRIDAEHPLVLTVAGPEHYEYWAALCDALQAAPFPLPAQPLTLVAESVARARKALEPWQHLTAVLQAGWQSDPTNQPSFAQARVMLYLALINGAQGVFWYAFRDPGWRLEDTPLWERFRELNEETTLLSGPILSGQPAPQAQVVADGQGLQWLARDLEKRTWCLLANPTDKPLHVTVAAGGAAENATGSAADLHGKALTVTDGKVTVELPAVSAETIVFGRPLPPVAAPRPPGGDDRPPGPPTKGNGGPPAKR